MVPLVVPLVVGMALQVVPPILVVLAVGMTPQVVPQTVGTVIARHPSFHVGNPSSCGRFGCNRSKRYSGTLSQNVQSCRT